MVGARAAPPSSGTMMAPEGPPPLVICDWSLVIVVGVVALLAPGRAGAEAVVIFRDGEVRRVERAEELPDRVRIQTRTGSAAELPRGVPAEPAGPRTVEVPRGEGLAVFPVPNLPAEARPHAERSGDLAGRLADQVRRDLERAWSAPSRPRR